MRNKTKYEDFLDRIIGFLEGAYEEDEEDDLRNSLLEEASCLYITPPYEENGVNGVCQCGRNIVEDRVFGKCQSCFRTIDVEVEL